MILEFDFSKKVLNEPIKKKGTDDTALGNITGIQATKQKMAN